MNHEGVTDVIETNNTRRTLISVAEHALRCWNVSTREHATALLPQWPFVDGLDDDMRVEVLSRFPLDEPLMVAGRDFLATAASQGDTCRSCGKTQPCGFTTPHPIIAVSAVKADAVSLVAETVAALDEPKLPREYRDKDGDLWLEYEPGIVKCIQRGGVRTSALAWPVQLESARIAYGPLVEVVPQPTAEAVQ